MMRAKADVHALAEPFPIDVLEWRVMRAGVKDEGLWAVVVPYVTKSAIQDLLDRVIGPDGWQVQFHVEHGHMACGIGILTEHGWIWKWDGTGAMASSASMSVSDAGKGDFSNAFKRAAAQWGIARYLAFLPEMFLGQGRVFEDPKHGAIRAEYRKRVEGKKDQRVPFSYNPPPLPEWALPGGSGRPTEDGLDPATGEIPDRPKATSASIDCPKCGGGMFDNREKKASGEFSERSPDLKCKDKECDLALWLGRWAATLEKQLTDHAEHIAGAGDLLEKVRSGAPALLLEVHRAIEEAKELAA